MEKWKHEEICYLKIQVLPRNRNIHSTCEHCFIHSTNILNPYHIPRAVLDTLNNSNRNPGIYILAVGESQQVINRINSTFMICEKVMDAVKLEYGENEHICPHKNLLMNVRSSIVHNSQCMEMTQMPINWRTDK